MAVQLLSVKELNTYMQSAVRRAPFLQQINVTGELSNFKAYSSGHWYFSLKDQEAAVRCVMFRGYNQSVDFVPVNGQQVELTASADFYIKSGEFQLSAKTMLPAGLGQRYQELERLKAKLQAEGLFAAEHKRPLPFLPRKIGVVTSPSGAVIRDIIHVLSRRYPNIQLLLAPAQVQGAGAAATLIAGLAQLNARADVDLIIIGRGGGSLEDLWEFNDEALARAVFHSRLPVISAVGHETDYTICDFVADLRAPTPSAAAELAVPEKTELLLGLEDMENRARTALQAVLTAKSERLRSLRQSPFMRSPQRLLDLRRERLQRLAASRALQEPSSLLAEARQRLDRAQSDLGRALPRRLELSARRLDELTQRFKARLPLIKYKDKQRLSHAAGRLDALSPLRVLSRGYALVSDEQSGRILSSVSGVRKGDRLELRMSDGSLSAAVLETRTDRNAVHEK